MFLKEKETGFSLEDKEEGKTHLILKDETGITVQTNRDLVVQADGEQKITGKKINVTGKKALSLLQKSTGVEIKNKIRIKGSRP